MSNSIFNHLDSSLGVLICGHGSRDKKALLEFKQLVEKLKAKLKNVPVEYGYLEFAQPIIPEALNRLRSRGVKKVIALPAMLFAAGHAKNDIPSILNKYSLETGILIQYGRELGINSLMIGAAGARIKESIDSALSFPISETLLVVVGRGSSDPDANSNVSKITRMLVEGFGFGWGETVFSGVTFPLVEPGLRHMIKLGFRRIVVFPYFLFTGVLINRINKHTEKVGFEHPEIEFLKSSYLCHHPLVIETFIERIIEVLKGTNSMNCSLCKYRSNLLGFESEVGLIQQSNHHHCEGLNDNCPYCGSDLKFESDELRESSLVETLKQQSNEHHHHLYPHSQHPLGPVTLRGSK
tara:strand:- start:225 stop:1280 length:1056 start_codon:yes stop_codon:yes gene_type:complete